LARDQPGRRGSVDQLDGAVVTHEQVSSHVPDGRTARVGMPPDRQQELVLRRGEPGRLGLLAAPAEEAAQACAKG
jgi:hypothetical protein